MVIAERVEVDYESLVLQYLPLVRRLCRRFYYLGEPMEDLIQVGNVGLIKAVNKFKPERGTRFISFASPVIVGEVKSYFRDHGWAVKLPRKLQSQKLAVDRAVATLSQTLGRTPAISEIAEATGLSEDKVRETYLLELYGRPISLDVAHEPPQMANSYTPTTLLDTVGQEDPELTGLAVRMDLEESIRRLPPQEGRVLCLKFQGGLSQTEIAARIGVSQMQVSRLLRWAVDKLRENLSSEETEE